MIFIENSVLIPFQLFYILLTVLLLIDPARDPCRFLGFPNGLLMTLAPRTLPA